MSQNLTIKPRTKHSDRLQHYINESTRRIGILESRSSIQYDDELCEIARDSLKSISPSQRDALISVLQTLEFRKNILKKVEGYTKEWGGNVTIIENIEEVIMGDIFKDINQSVIATRGSIAEGVITLKNTGKDEIAEAIAELDTLVASTKNEELPEEKKAECASLLDGITEQAKKSDPNRSVLRALGNSLAFIINNVESLSKVAEKAIKIIMSW